ncbi:hypothetical protein [Streptomyces sp. NPDC001744]|uniref:hypothetical protein n=1 Tax=Streptomyces sp. NPDC001744 TaxID=3364606 RepID=UPI003673E7BB
MGIESDRLVDDYLSRVGDLAQRRQLPAGDRARLVSTLRNEIDRRRATRGEEDPAAVRGILGDLGSPDEVVDRAAPERGGVRGSGGNPGAARDPEDVRGPAPGPRTGKPSRRGERGRGGSSGGAPPGTGARDGSGAGGPAGSGPGRPGIPAPRPGASDPGGPLFHGGVAGAAFDGPGEPDWWRAEEEAAGVPGFVGGVERPDLFRPPEPPEDEDEEEAGDPAPGKRRPFARLLRRRRAGTPEPAPAAEPAAPSRPRFAGSFVLLAALLLLGGAVFGSLVALAAGWLLAHASRRLTPGEAKAAVLVIPGLSAASGIVWLWGRVEGRWGAPVGAGGEAMGAAVSETWPWVLRGAAVASALFLLWRARRPRRH